MRWQILNVLILLLSLLVSSFAVGVKDPTDTSPSVGMKGGEDSNGPMVGGWSDVTNSNDAEKEDVVKWAISEAKKANGVDDGDRFQVVSVKAQVVSGMNFSVTLKRHAKDGKCYEHHMVIYDVPWKKERSITKDETKEIEC